MPLEEVLIGQDAEAVSAVLLVDLRDGDGIEVGADEPGGGRRFLDLGDESDRIFRFEAGDEVANGGGVSEPGLEFGDGDARFGRGDFGSLVGDDSGEGVLHGWVLVERRRLASRVAGRNGRISVAHSGRERVSF